MIYIKNTKVPVNRKEKVLQFLLATSYMIAKMHFAEEYKVKLIDWSSYETKVTPTLPKWRAQGHEKPHHTKPYCTIQAVQKLNEGKHPFDGKDIEKSMNIFCNRHN